jgi:two-component system, OmpR family, phosphate regulon response regulator PhoB
MRKILLLEDDETLGTSLLERLSQDFEVSWAKTVKEASKLLGQTQFDLAILDIGLPDGDGFQVGQLAREKSKCHLVFLTARADAESRLKGFEMGAEEFIPKPFFLKELILRVRHVLEIHTPKQEIQLKKMTISLNDMSIRYSSGKIEYPPLTDMKILKLLIEKSPEPVSRDEMFDAVWGNEKTPNLRTVDNTIVRLRALLGEDGESRIRSVRSVGYQWLSEGDNT